MKLPNIKGIDFKLPALPKIVLISVSVIGAFFVFFVLMYFTLGSARDTAEQDVTRLRADISSVQARLKQSREDYDFVIKNQQRFETLVASDKLIPHTRRTAVRQMQALALEFGLSSLNYNFQAAGLQAPEAVANQPKSTDYRVYVENIELSIGAPLDKSVYSFMAAVYDDFPGSMVLTDLEMGRAAVISPEALNLVSRGEDSKIVTGTIRYSWRTAQKQDEKK
ncbi:MAG: hypothetical protein JNK21_01075 [Rhodospirillaceae bacterium]|nr:hypothetical protein [Rhodospirillaceae bacterium]